MTTRLYHGDCLDVMAGMDANSVDTIITDPPYGLSFMGKEWDHGVPGMPFWEAALRVAKPGAMMLAFGGTRTHHRLMCAIEDAGWEIRDCVMWLQGQGFPKSHDISKAIDKAAGAEREVVGTYRAAVKTGIQGGAIGSYDVADGTQTYATVTLPATPDAATWDGYGTALKPAWEPIILAMAPLDGTFAHNALTWGVGGLWVDGGRIPTNGETPTGTGNRQSWRDMEGRSDLQPHGLNITPSAGRWPANLILSHSPDCKRVGVRKVGSGSGGPARHNANEGTVAKGKQYEHVTQNYGTETVEAWECVEGCPVAMLDAQSGESTSIVCKPPPKDIGDYEGRQFNDYGAYRPKQYEAGHNDTGGASRFFMSIPSDVICPLCDLPLTPKHGIMSETNQEVIPCKSSSANSAARSLKTIRQTIASIAPENVPTKLVEQIALNVPFVESLCDSCATRIAVGLVAIKILGSNSEGLQAILGSISSYKRCILIQSLVSFAGLWENIDTILIMTSLSILCGSVLHAITSCIPETKRSGPTRFLYCPKASRSERNKGLEGMEKTVNHSAYGEFAGTSEHASNKGQPRANNHPTVKPLALMRYLVKLTRTPTGGIVLDPFMGSGSTGVAAVLEGRGFVGIELGAESYDIATQRIEAAQAEMIQTEMVL